MRISRNSWFFILLLLFSPLAYSANGHPDWNMAIFTSEAENEECQGIYAGDSTDERFSAALFTCALVVCGHHEFYDRAECAFFRSLSHQENFTSYFQDIKNYLALMDLEEAKHQAVKAIESSRFVGKEIYLGVKSNLIENAARDLRDENDKKFVAHNLLAKESYASDMRFVKSHLKDFCSEFDEFYGYCQSTGRDIPHDLLAGSLLNETLLADDKKISAVNAYLFNGTNASPIHLQRVDKIYTNPSAAIKANQPRFLLSNNGYTHLREKFFHNMLISTTQESLRKMYSDRLYHVSETGEKLPAGVTKIEALAGLRSLQEVEGGWRLTDPNWYKETDGMQSTGVLREINAMLAGQLKQGFELDQQLERIEMHAAIELIFLYRQIQAVSGQADNSKTDVQKLQEAQRTVEDLFR